MLQGCVKSVLSCLLFFGVVFFSGCDRTGGAVEQPLGIGKPFPEISLMTYDKKPFNVSELKGKVVILKLWATWCAICLEEAPKFAVFSKKLDEEVVVVSVSVDRDLNLAKEYLLDHPSKFIELFDQSMLQTKSFLKTSVIPQVYLIDRSGVLRDYFIGAITWDASMLQKIQKIQTFP